MSKNSSEIGLEIVSTEKSHFDEHLQLDEVRMLQFQPKSPLRPISWSTKKKLAHTVLYGLTTFCAQFNSTTMSFEYCVDDIRNEFGVSREVVLLLTSLYILGIAFGPMVFAPLSEVYGRKIGIFAPFFMSAMLTFATGISYSLGAMMVTRFLGGFFAGAPIVASGGVLGDIWSPAQRGAAFAFYACFVINGAALGPTIGSLLSMKTNWRNPQWFIGGLSVFIIVICCHFLHETYEPVLLAREANKERLKSGSWEIHSKLDTWDLNIRELVKIHMVRPFAILATPIVFLMSLFASYVYGLFYLILTNVSEAFNLAKGWKGTTGTLPCISLLLGVLFGCVGNMLWANRYASLVEKNNGEPLPEQRLPVMMILGWLMPAGIFIFGWTCSPTIPWPVPCLGIMMMGCGFITIFQGSLNYLIDTYACYSASAIAAATFLRSVFAASFPLFAKQLFVSLNVHWGASLIGFIALGMIPIPYLFFVFGKRIREKNVFIPGLE
ncbi:hypothetical protein KL919_003521 [Ogataea angusta]|nr:hypothetical protein KL919_003521 [Ogataea angusta]